MLNWLPSSEFGVTPLTPFVLFFQVATAFSAFLPHICVLFYCSIYILLANCSKGNKSYKLYFLDRTIRTMSLFLSAYSLLFYYSLTVVAVVLVNIFKKKKKNHCCCSFLLIHLLWQDVTLMGKPVGRSVPISSFTNKLLF